jgi:5-methyltetrahydropteroyltriglutamate--homocysteine methyltransferase
VTAGNPILDGLRIDQVGSLLRPAALLEAYARHETGALDTAGLRAAQDAAVRAVIAHQEAIGLGVVTDGEFRRIGFQDSFGLAVSGYAATADSLQRQQEVAQGAQPHTRRESGLHQPGPAITNRRPVVERLKLVRNLPLEEFTAAQQATTVPVKVALVGPDRISQRFAWEESQTVYADMDAFLADVVAIEREMIRQLVEAGCRYVQIDAPGYTAYVDPPSLARMEARGEDPRANLERSIQADNAVIAGFPGVTFGIHICRGNERSMWHREGAYDAVAETLFSELDHQRLLLEYDTERAGSFEPLRFVRKGAIAVLGLVTTKTGDLETEAGLIQRVRDAAEVLPLEQLALSPQCGFASGILGNLLSEEQQWRKLELVVQTARNVWG